jgi:alpha-ketoglutarate-dependent taurine dioxygenase
MPADTVAGCTVEPLAPFGAVVRPTGSRAIPGADELRDLLLRNRVLALRGFDPAPTKEALAAEAEAWGPLLAWDFGTVFEVVEHDDPKNYLFTSGSVPYHWDGAFAARVPWLQVFQCLEAPGTDQGGETLFCDTSRVWAAADADTRRAWEAVEIEYATRKVAHYGGSIRARLVAAHPLTGEPVLRFNEPANAATADLNTPEVRPLGMDEDAARALVADLTRRVYDPAAVYAHAWAPGDRVIADNFVLLHGRTPYRSQRPRRLWRVHVL